MIWDIITVATIAIVLGAVLLRLRSRKAHPIALGAMIFPSVLATHPPGGRALSAGLGKSRTRAQRCRVRPAAPG